MLTMVPVNPLNWLMEELPLKLTPLLKSGETEFVSPEVMFPPEYSLPNCPPDPSVAELPAVTGHGDRAGNRHARTPPSDVDKSVAPPLQVKAAGADAGAGADNEPELPSPFTMMNSMAPL